MVGWLCGGEEKYWFPKLETVRPMGQALLRAALPRGKPFRSLGRSARALARRDVRRVLLEPELHGEESAAILARYGLGEVDPLPLCLAQGDRLALFFLRDLPAPRRRIALRGEQAGSAAWAIARKLCPQVGALLLDFDRGEEELARGLRAAYGAAPLHLGQGLPPQAAVELAPREPLPVPTLCLFGEPDLSGLSLHGPEALPPRLPELPFLTLLWETGRLRLEDMEVALAGNGLDRRV